MNRFVKPVSDSRRLIAASILAADFAHLADDVNAVLQAGADSIHFDVMDHHFVPNLSFGACICSALREAGIKAPIDVHLMVSDPEFYIEPFANAGADLLTFHPETVSDVASVLNKIKRAGLQAGLVFNPDKPVVIPDDCLPQLDMVLLMSVFPGFGGQQFMPDVLEKAKKTRHWLHEKAYQGLLAIDGGIKVDNIAQAAQAGIDYFIVGSGLFAADDYQKRLLALRE